MRARFWINLVTRKVKGTAEDGTTEWYGDVELNAVSRTTDDAINWAHYTPVGRLTLTVNGHALAWFMEHQGEDVYLDLTPIVAGE